MKDYYLLSLMSKVLYSGVTLNFVLGGAKHTFWQKLGANLGLLLIEIQNIGGAKAP